MVQGGGFRYACRIYKKRTNIDQCLTVLTMNYSLRERANFLIRFSPDLIADDARDREDAPDFL
jgi:hypothetical protein